MTCCWSRLQVVVYVEWLNFVRMKLSKLCHNESLLKISTTRWYTTVFCKPMVYNAVTFNTAIFFWYRYTISRQSLWKSRISIPTKLKLYNTCILPIFLYGSEMECWAVTKLDACRIDALDQWCLRPLLGIKWHHYVRSDEVRRITKQLNLTAIIQSLHIWAHCTYGWWYRCILTAALLRTGKDHQGILVSHGWTPSNETWEPTTLHWTKQSIWLRTALCEGWCLSMALRTPSSACQKRKKKVYRASLAPHHSIFYRPVALSDAWPTVS